MPKKKIVSPQILSTLTAFKRPEAAAYCRISTSTLSRIGPPADINKGRVRIWSKKTLDKWLNNK